MSVVSRMTVAAAALSSVACGKPKPAQVVPSAANAHLIDTQGRETGTAAVIERRSGGLLVLKLRSIPPGVHGLHLHTTGM